MANQILAVDLSVQKKYQQILTEQSKNTDELPLAVIPGIDIKEERLAQEVKKSFIQFLIKQFRHAKSKTYDLSKDQRELDFRTTKYHIKLDPSDNDIAIKMCTLCRGYCCYRGEKYAYITPTMLKQIIQKNAKKSILSIVRTYTNDLPQHYIKGSCVYHTDKGCSLTPDFRSDVCNNFYCKPLAEAIKDIRKQPKEKRCVIAKNESYVVNSAVI